MHAVGMCMGPNFPSVCHEDICAGDFGWLPPDMSKAATVVCIAMHCRALPCPAMHWRKQAVYHGPCSFEPGRVRSHCFALLKLC